MPTTDRTRRVLVVASAALGLATASAVMLTRRLPPVALHDSGDDNTLRNPNAYYGQQYVFGSGPFRNITDKTVQIVDARLLEPTPGLTLNSAHAVNNCDGRSQFVLAGTAPIKDDFPATVLHPLTEAVLEPHGKACWYVLFTVTPDTPGVHQAEAVELTYKVGKRERSQRVSFRIELGATRPGPDPDA